MFFFIGSSRSGSTWLAKAFLAHPGIKQPVKKPVRFWNLKVFGHRDEKSSHPELSLDAYKALFAPEPGILKGDMTDGYNVLGIQEVGAIQRHYPDAKILQMMRRPTDIAVSHFALHRELSTLTVDDIQSQLVHPSGYQHNNLRQIQAWKIWAKTFGKSNVHLMFFEDFFADPARGLSEIYQFLGVPNHDLGGELATKRVNQRRHTDAPTEEVRAAIARFCDPLDAQYETFKARQTKAQSPKAALA